MPRLPVASLGPHARAALGGAGYVGALAAAALVAGAGDDRVQGVHAEAVRALVLRSMSGEVGRAAAFAVALGVLVGAALGVVASLLVELRVALGATPPTRRVAQATAVAALLHAWSVADDVAARPAVHAPYLYARGGAARFAQVLATDLLGRGGVTLVVVAALVAWLLAPAWRRRALPSLPRRPLAALAATLACGALLLHGPPRLTPHPRAGDPRRPSVLVIAVDSLRADRLDPRTMPRVSRYAEQATTFTRAYVTLPRTFPSWVTWLTGRFPHHHGVRHMFPRWEARARDLGALPRRFGQAGYRTAVVSDFAGDVFGRIDLGFARIDTPTFDFREIVWQRTLALEAPLAPVLATRTARRLVPSVREMSHASDPHALTREALAAIDDAGDEPFFATVFYSTAHFPYAAPAPLGARFTDPAYRGRFKYAKPNLLGDEVAPDADDVRQIRALYDGAVLATDDAIGALLDGLARRGLDERTIVVVTADHGESLYEHGRGQGHGDWLFGDEGQHVPLVVHDPRRPGAHRVETLVRDVDLAPTLLALAGLPTPPTLDGRSLAGALDGAELAPALAYAESELWFTPGAIAPELRLPYPDLAHLTEVRADHGDDVVLRAAWEPVTLAARHRSVRDSRWKLVYVPTRDAARLSLFDTEADPGETADVAAAHPEVVARLEADLMRWMLEDPTLERQGDRVVPRPEAWHRDAVGASTLRVDEGAAP